MLFSGTGLGVLDIIIWSSMYRASGLRGRVTMARDRFTHSGIPGRFHSFWDMLAHNSVVDCGIVNKFLGAATEKGDEVDHDSPSTEYHSGKQLTKYRSSLPLIDPQYISTLLMRAGYSSDGKSQFLGLARSASSAIP